MSYQQGGWYNNPQSGKNQQYWNGQWFDKPQQGQSSGGNSNNPAQTNPIYAGAIDQENKYIQSLMDQNKGQLDLTLKQLDAQHQLALGNNDQQTAKFLESVANSMESQVGRIPYDYQNYTHRELQSYGQGNQGIAQGRSLALQKLANDEQNQQSQLDYNKQQGTQQNMEDLNSRGIINGQTYQGAGGVAGQQRDMAQQPFKQQQNYLTNSYNTNVGGVNQDYNLQQQNLDLNHTNTMQDIQTNARRGVQDQQQTYTLGTGQANQNYQNQMAALQRQKAQLIAGDLGPATQLYGKQKGVLGYGS